MYTPRRDVDAQLDAVYADIPDVACLGLCQLGCSSVAMTPLEQRRIAERHGITLPLATAPPGTPVLHPGQQEADHCPALADDGRCRVYADRPLVCRMYGAAEGLECPFGCKPEGGLLDRPRSRRLMLRVVTLPSDTSR
jgi:hypothetical protein